MTIDDIDVVEINEAFAAQMLPSHGELHPGREAQPVRRRDRPRPSLRDDRRAHHDDAAERPRHARRRVRHRVDVRRRRHGHGHARPASSVDSDNVEGAPGLSVRSCSSVKPAAVKLAGQPFGRNFALISVRISSPRRTRRAGRARRPSTALRRLARSRISIHSSRGPRAPRARTPSRSKSASSSRLIDAQHVPVELGGHAGACRCTRPRARRCPSPGRCRAAVVVPGRERSRRRRGRTARGRA